MSRWFRLLGDTSSHASRSARNVRGPSRSSHSARMIARGDRLERGMAPVYRYRTCSASQCLHCATRYVASCATNCVASGEAARYKIRSMTRLPPREPPHDPTTIEDLVKLMPPGVPPLRLFLTLAHNPRVLHRVPKGGLLDPGSLALRAREIVILRTCALCRSEYEWGVHVRFFARSEEHTS